MMEILERIRKGERVDHYETTRRTKDGATITISLTVSPIHDSAGRIVGASAIARDITERERVQDQARYARSLIEASVDPLVTISPEGKITDVNEATIRVTGVARDELVGTDFSDYFTEPDEARAGYRQVFAQGLRHRLPADHPPYRRCPDRRALQRLGLQGRGRERAGRVRRRPRRHRAETGRARVARRQGIPGQHSPEFYKVPRSSARTSAAAFSRGTRERTATTATRPRRSSEETPASCTHPKTWRLAPSIACSPRPTRTVWPRVRSGGSGRTAPGSRPASS